MNPYAKYHTYRGYMQVAKNNPEWVKQRQRTRTLWAIVTLAAAAWAVVSFAVGESGALKMGSLIALGTVAALGVAACILSDLSGRPDGDLINAAAASVVRAKDGRIYRVRWRDLPSPQARFEEARFEEALADRTGQNAQVQIIDQVSRLRFYGEYVDVLCTVTAKGDQTARRNQRVLIFRDNPDFAGLVRRLDNRCNNVS